MPDVSMGPGMINTGWEYLDEEAVCVKRAGNLLLKLWCLIQGSIGNKWI